VVDLYGVRTGSFPAAAASALHPSSTTHFQNDLSAGLSYANEYKMTFWLEYHLHQAGFSRQDWSWWFAEGTGPNGPSLAPLLWYIRGYAQEQQVPTSKDALFLRADWTDAFVFQSGAHGVCQRQLVRRLNARSGDGLLFGDGPLDGGSDRRGEHWLASIGVRKPSHSTFGPIHRQTPFLSRWRSAGSYASSHL